MSTGSTRTKLLRRGSLGALAFGMVVMISGSGSGMVAMLVLVVTMVMAVFPTARRTAFVTLRASHF